MNATINFDDLAFWIREGEDQMVIDHIEYHNLFTAVDTEERTLLHYAVYFDNPVIAKYLLHGNCPVNHEDKNKITALMLAMKGTNTEIMKILFEAGANVIGTLGFFSAERMLPPTIRLLFLQELQKKYSTIEEMAVELIKADCRMYQIVVLNNPSLIEQLLKGGLSSNSMKPVENKSALHIAVINSYAEIVRLLLEFGANVNAADSDGAHPLYYMYNKNFNTTSEKVEILKLLINAGASLMSLTSAGNFQVAQALLHGNAEIVRAILQTDIDFTARDKDLERSILHMLAMNTNEKVMDELKCYIHRCDVNMHDKLQTTLLMIAVAHANVDMVKLLLENGADPNWAEERFNSTALYFAYAEPRMQDSENNYYECIELLLQYNADTQIIVTRKGEERTIFDVASRANNLHRIKPIIAHLARLEALGTLITEITYNKLNSHDDLKKYFEDCRQMLREQICESVTVLGLITGDKKTLAPHFKNEKQILKLERFSYSSKAILSYPHYYTIIRRRLSEALYDKRFKKKASEVVRKILPSYFPCLAIDKITSYFNHNDLCRLYEL